MSARLAVRDLHRSRGDRTVLANLSFELGAGRILALVGANGAGKTSLLRVLGGLDRPQRGAVELDGRPVGELRGEDRARLVCAIASTEPPGWMDFRSLRRLFSVCYPRWSEKAFDRLRSRLDVPPWRRYRELSRGQCARATAAFAIAAHPDLLLLDEPLANIDPAARDEVVTAIVEAVADTGMSVVVSTHELDEILRIADRVLLLRRDASAAQGEVEALIERFRRIELSHLGRTGRPLPKGMAVIDTRDDGAVIVDTEPDPALLRQRVESCFHGAHSMSIRSMSLREILLTIDHHEELDPQGRGEPEPAVVGQEGRR